jgi:chromosome segregation ATPase
MARELRRKDKGATVVKKFEEKLSQMERMGKMLVGKESELEEKESELKARESDTEKRENAIKKLETETIAGLDKMTIDLAIMMKKKFCDLEEKERELEEKKRELERRERELERRESLKEVLDKNVETTTEPLDGGTNVWRELQRRKKEETRRNKYRTCVVCEKPSNRYCTQCKVSYYCSTECQRIDWKRRHKDECMLMWSQCPSPLTKDD